jgi:hypothetical protein
MRYFPTARFAPGNQGKIMDEKKPATAGWVKAQAAVKAAMLSIRLRLLRKGAFFLANQAGENRLFDSKIAEYRVSAAACTFYLRATTMIANVTRSISRLKHSHLAFQYPKLFLKLGVFRLKRFALGVNIRVLALKCGLLGLDESKVLSENRRRAVLVDEFFKMVEQSHVKPLK